MIAVPANFSVPAIALQILVDGRPNHDMPADRLGTGRCYVIRAGFLVPLDHLRAYVMQVNFMAPDDLLPIHWRLYEILSRKRFWYGGPDAPARVETEYRVRPDGRCVTRQLTRYYYNAAGICYRASTVMGQSDDMEQDIRYCEGQEYARQSWLRPPPLDLQILAGMQGVYVR